ncbi:N-acetylmuramoyl-L-alanine amidase [Rhizobium azibense]|nr:N-acetylmuramoyl-L-alanine amidase [Rhizobium azibense]
MSDLDILKKRINSGEKIKFQEFEDLLAQQEAIEDALEIMRGNANGLRGEPFTLRASGLGLAIVVGHTQNAQGAYGGPPINQSEYVWNKDLASRITAACSRLGVPAKIFYRDNVGISGAYQQVLNWGATCVMELHFNAHMGAAKGTETLYDAETNSGSKEWAKRLQRAMLEALGTADRDLKERDPGGRGYESVSAIDIPSALVEPFFGDNVSDATKGHNNKDELAEALARAAAAQLGTLSPFWISAAKPRQREHCGLRGK